MTTGLAPEARALYERFAGELGPQRRARVAVSAAGAGRFDVAVVAFDSFALLPLVCGWLAAHGLDVESGQVRTLALGLDVRGQSGLRVVDVFRVRPLAGEPPAEAALEQELLEMLDRAAQGGGQEVRDRLHVRLAEALPAEPPVGEPAPVDIAFDTEDDPEWTVMDVRGPDAPGFLYALTSALALRGVYVHEVKIARDAQGAHDRFRLGRRGGGRLDTPAEQEALRRAVSLIRAFTAFLAEAPDPARALRSFDQLLDETHTLDGPTLAPFSTPQGLADLARILGSSAFLWEDRLRGRAGRLLPLLAGVRERPPRPCAALTADLRARLRAAPRAEWTATVDAFRTEETLLLEARRVLDPGFTLPAFARALTALAETLVAESVRAVDAALEAEHGLPLAPSGAPCRLAVCALGKFGGAEMGYASDLEVVFFYSGPGETMRSARPAGWFFDEVVRGVSAVLAAPEQGLFHLDLRLRPHGSKGPLSCPLEEAREYYSTDGAAAPFERQALIKLRAVAGDAALGEAVLRVRDGFVWSGAPWDGADAVRLRTRQARELVPAGRFNVKLSRGGLVDAEYAVQYLQLQHGAAEPALRAPSTLDALDALRASGIVDAADHAVLAGGYRFWREVADALRIVRGQSGDVLLPPPGSDDYGFLARRLGYPGGRRVAAAALEKDVAHHRGALAALYDRRFTPAAAP